jgi:hypothetical protein
MENCLNCGTELKGKYCYSCGQEKISRRMTVNSLFHDFLHSSFHWESSLINTVKELFVSPGNFIHNYINGKRKSFTKPISFFILMVTVFVILFHLFSDNFITFVNQALMGDSADKYHPGGVSVVEVQHFFFSKINYFFFVLAPIFAFYFSIFFRRLKLNFAEALTFSFYVIGMGLFFSLFFVLIALVNVKFWSLRLIITFAYYIYAMISFSKGNKAADFFKSLGVIILAYLSFGIIMGIFGFIYLKLSH